MNAYEQQQVDAQIAELNAEWHERFVHVDQKRMAAEARVAELEAALTEIAGWPVLNLSNPAEVAQAALKGQQHD